MMEEVFLHVDLDAFFASVEQLDNPELRGKPVIVGGLPGDRRSVVSTASYEARKYGVHSAMPTARAYELCPNGIFVHGRMKRYQEKSAEVMAIFRMYSPDVFQISVDEAFIDLTGTERLLGSPYDVAVRLKKQVHDETGLTVSVGLASTMYIAKIASGYHKPDGLTVVKPGEETSFMLALPLEKVWGVGSKTLDHLHRAGFTTTKGIYNKSKALLQSIFGENTGSFLYEAVRGNKGMRFGEEAENHSLSSETTFDFDLLDRYAIDTALMELSQTVMFRLHREDVHSRTLGLKIRYEDFTTVSIQETSERPFTSADDMYERCKRLFTKKYETGRGIRLLGVAAQNVEANSVPVQTELFDFGDAKKAKVEKAILALENKHPGVKIEKARTMRENDNRPASKKMPLVILLAGALLSFTAPKIFAETEQVSESSGAGAIVFSSTIPYLPDVSSDEAPVSLFNYTVASSNIEFLASGYWQSEIANTTTATFGYGNAFALSLGTPVFTQTVDLTLWFMMNKTWYFESAFADSFKKNTVAAGYKGTGILKHVRIANRGISFPTSYSASKTGRSIGGGDNSAPGILFHFEDTCWTADGVIRYDMLAQKSKSFSGMNTVSTTTLKCASYVTGRQYILPSSESVSAVTAVYVESSGGTYKDTIGRTYKKLSSSDYLLIPSKNMIALSSAAGAAKANSILPAVAVTFSSSTIVASVKTALGSYGTADSPGDEGTFLGDVQRFFGSSASDNAPDLTKFSYTMFTTIDSADALLIQYPSSFSPFALCARYNGGSYSDADAVVVHTSTETTDASFSAFQSEDDTALVSSDFFSTNQLWLTVQDDDDDGSDYTKPKTRFPFAAVNPSCYLGYTSSSDLAVELRTFTAVTSYSIGTDAAAGTVTLYINNIIDYGASYDSGTGIVTPSRSIGDSDQVYITWSEDSGTTSGGAIAAGLGFAYAFTPSFTTDVSLTSRWTLSPSQSFADADTPAPGFASFTTGMTYKTDTISASNTLSLSLDNANTTGYYRMLGMDDSSEDNNYLSTSSGVLLPADFAPSLNSRDYTSTTALDTTYCGSPESVTPVQDSSISGYKVPLTWNFSSLGTEAAYAWAAVAIDLGSTGASLAGATTFSMALESLSTSRSGYEVYLQLGVSASNSFTVEDTATIPTWLISKSSTSAENSTGVQYAFVPTLDASAAGCADGTKQLGSGWQQVTVSLDDVDRARLCSQYDARIIIVAPLEKREETSFPAEGSIYIGPWSYAGSSFASSYDNDVMTLSLAEEADTSLSSDIVSTFNAASTNTVEKATWHAAATDESSLPSNDDAQFTLTRAFDGISLASYSTLNMYFKYTGSSALTSSKIAASAGTSDEPLLITLTRPDSAGTATTALKVSLTSKELSSLSDEYHLLTVDLKNCTVSIDGTTFADATSNLYVNTAIIPVQISYTVSILSYQNTCLYRSGEFDVDELYLSGSTYALSAVDEADFSWKKEGTLLQAGNTVLLKDFSLTATGTGTLEKDISDSSSNDSRSSNSKSAAGSGSVSFTALDVSFAFDAAASYSSTSETDATLTTTASDTTGLTTAGYTIATTAPLFKALSFTSYFRTSPVSEARSAGNKCTLSLSPLHVPLSAVLSAESSQSLWTATQKASGSLSFSTKPYILAADASCIQKKSRTSTFAEDSFASGFTTAQKEALSSGDFSATRRTITAQVKQTFIIPFANLKPELLVNANGVTASSTLTDSSETSCSIPFALGTNAFTLSWAKKTGGVQNASSSWTGTTLLSGDGAYFADAQLTTTSLYERNWYWKSLPFADIFSVTLPAEVLSSSSSADVRSYTGTYAASWKRPLSNSYKDMLLPSGASISFARDISASATIADTYQIKSALSYAALNLFGTLGPYRTFSWYEQDSFTTSLSATLKIPHDDSSALTMVYAGYSEADFFLKKDGTLKSGLEGTFTDTTNWTAKTTAVWKRTVSSSPVVSLAYLFYPKFDMKKIKLSRTDSMNYSITSVSSSTTTDATVTLTNSFGLTHLLEAQITKYLTLNGSIAGTYTCTVDKIMSLSCTGTLGGKVSF